MEENQLDIYKAKCLKHYEDNIPHVVNKFPSELCDQTLMEIRIRAAYEILVNRRGGNIVWDEATTDNIKKVTSWIYDQKHRWLLLYGAFGNGKTTMLTALSSVFPFCQYLTANSIYEYFKTNEILPKIGYNKILLIDDLGTEPQRCLIFGEERTPIVDLLLQRYSFCATTIIATNLDIIKIKERYSDRLHDRLCEISACILYDTPSYRGR